MQKIIKIVRKVCLIGMFCWSAGFTSTIEPLTSEPLSHDAVKRFIHNPVVKESIQQIMNGPNELQYYSIAALVFIKDLLACGIANEYYIEKAQDVNLRLALVRLTGKQSLNDFSQYLKDIARAIMHGRGFCQGLVCVNVSDGELELYTDTLKFIRLYNKHSSGIIPQYIHSTEIKDEEILNAYAKKVNELMYAERRNTLPKDAMSAGDEFIALSGNDDAFKQKYSDWACNLYSYLYAVAQNKRLSKELASQIFKDTYGNYYISGIKIKKDEIDNIKTTEEKKLHPSNVEVVKAIGVYVQKRMAKEMDTWGRGYFIANVYWKEDFLFGRPYKRIPSWDNAKQFSSDGTLIVDKKTYSGDFVVSLVGSPNNSYCHARSIYYDKVKGEWCYYDNQRARPAVIKDCDMIDLKADYANILGYFEEK